MDVRYLGIVTVVFIATIQSGGILTPLWIMLTDLVNFASLNNTAGF